MRRLRATARPPTVGAARRYRARRRRRWIAIDAEPDGLNINDGCGSTHLDGLREAVLEHGADLGIALDGDADRCLAVDAARRRRRRRPDHGDPARSPCASAGTLADDTVVATVMSNLGFARRCARAGITVHQTAVGDRYVLEALRAGGFTLGGEQCGHVILSDYATTGDGILTALHVMAADGAHRPSLAELAVGRDRGCRRCWSTCPVVDRTPCAATPAVAAAVRAARRSSATTGRILLRPSGTEPLVRVMVEAAASRRRARSPRS